MEAHSEDEMLDNLVRHLQEREIRKQRQSAVMSQPVTGSSAHQQQMLYADSDSDDEEEVVYIF